MLERIHKGGLSPEDCIRDAKDKANPFRLYGFGHRVYRNYDPRAKILKEVCDKVFAQLKRQRPAPGHRPQARRTRPARPLLHRAEAVSERRFLQRHLAAGDRHSHQHVHGLFRHWPPARLDCPVEGAARRSDEQDPPSAADLHRPDGDGLRADEEPVGGKKGLGIGDWGPNKPRDCVAGAAAWAS